ncbi:hypothetical protein [Nocardia heshunensis]
MGTPVYSQILIANTRTDGQNPNVLHAAHTAQGFVPRLAVYDKGILPPFCRWNIGWATPGAQYTLEMEDEHGNVYTLGVPKTALAGTPALLQGPSATDFCNSWAFPWPTRLLSGLGSGNHEYSGKLGTLSLDARQYPVPTVQEFDSKVNQTWEFGYSIDSLKTLPY